MKKEEEQMKDKYPWLEQGDERKNMSDREILDKYTDLDRSCLLDSEKNMSWICCTNIKMHLV